MTEHTYPVIPLDFSLRRAFLLKTFRTAGAVSLTGFLAACGGDGDDSVNPAPVDPKPPLTPNRQSRSSTPSPNSPRSSPPTPTA